MHFFLSCFLFSRPCCAPFARQPSCTQPACARGAFTSIPPRPNARNDAPTCLHPRGHLRFHILAAEISSPSLPSRVSLSLPPFPPEFNFQVKPPIGLDQARRDEARRATRWLHLRRHARAFRRKRGGRFLARPQRGRAAKIRSQEPPSEPRKRQNCRSWSNQGLD